MSDIRIATRSRSCFFGHKKVWSKRFRLVQYTEETGTPGAIGVLTRIEFRISALIHQCERCEHIFQEVRVP